MTGTLAPTSYSSIVKDGRENSGWESHTTVTNRIPVLDWQVSMVDVLVPHPPDSRSYSQPLLARTVHEAAGWYSFQHSRVPLDRKPPLSQKKQNCKVNKWEIHPVSVCLLDDQVLWISLPCWCKWARLRSQVPLFIWTAWEPAWWDN